ncbi:MAG: preprotein translocase subunit SecY [Candidatus Berkelbacteria bacterium Licking1014_7]|uniref:Protein translocase subunit SecY n=1 Tax=Candidatus Berkelbacteria bacterium Licking1014_7 TaxID=2017147 RepID=A0A554LKJ2_9BACT|nr:MAG: preprotein translocase subunit SecY [Candidatus Berkelbacteria bacterium Licking1014_7]
MLSSIKKIFVLRDLRRRILLTIILLIIVRFITQIPIPGITRETLQEFFSQNQILGLLDIFSGGTLSNFSIGLMGVGPYITASIILQLLTFIIPSLDELNKEGEQGKHKINQYTRMLTVPLSLIQSFSMIALLKSQDIIGQFSSFQLINVLLISTAVTIIMMWMGEIISEEGIGNGISLIITVGILGGIPEQIGNTTAIVFGSGEVDTTKLYGLIVFGFIAIATIIFIVLMNEAIRKIPISYARKIQSRSSRGLIDTYLPMKINTAGVIPIIFALSVIVFPGLLANFFTKAQSPIIANFAKMIVKFFDPNSFSYGATYFILVVAFTFFYTSIVFQPKQVAENLQKQGGFIPGIRPGKETENYIDKIIKRITFPGSLFLGVIAILPFIIQSFTGITTLVLGGTSLLILVSVVFETSNQLKAHLITRQYDAY